MSHTAAVFAGQGAQSPGMGRDLAEVYPQCKALFDKADEVLGYPISDICFNGPAEELTKTHICQPAIFVVSAACLKALEEEKPGQGFEAVAGLSLGEWTALYAAGVISFEQGLRILEARGRFMQEACDSTPGGMVSVMRLPVEKVYEIADESNVTVANLNSSEQIVLSGTKDGISRAEEAAKKAGGRAIVLKVAGAYHSPLMDSAAARLEKVLADETFGEPSLPVISNVTGKPHGSPDEIRAAMLAQVTGSVLWLDSVNWCVQNGITRFVEFGPGKTLAGLIKRIAPEALAFNVGDVEQAKSVAGDL